MEVYQLSNTFYVTEYESLTSLRSSYIMVKSLSEQDYQQLLAAIQTALITAKPADRAAIEQRLGELRFYWDDLQF